MEQVQPLAEGTSLRLVLREPLLMMFEQADVSARPQSLSLAPQFRALSFEPIAFSPERFAFARLVVMLGHRRR